MATIATPVEIEGDVLIPLSAMDAVMNTYRVVVLYIYPPPSSEASAFNLDKLQRSFVTLVNEDYPVLVGELHVHGKTISVKQTPVSRHQASSSKRDYRRQRIHFSGWGMAIGVDCSHVLFDGEAMLTFMKVWGQHYSKVRKNARLVVNHDRYLLSGTGETPRLSHPEFLIAPLEPLVRRKDGSLAPKTVTTPPKTDQHVFHFSSSSMAKLKKLAEGVEAEKTRHIRRKRERFLAKLLSIFSSKDKKIAQAPSPPYVSTLDAITALFTVLISQARGHGRSVRVSTAVNGRNRLQPPLPENYSGNAVFHAISTYTNEMLQAAINAVLLPRVARGVRASILERDNAFMRDTIAFISSQSDPVTINDNVHFFFGPVR
ncbi:Transferase family [Phytophthora infestans]|uniref:Transferase family n=1 Tax=Phytophthora infestans TaxID=4787 RepID=A0A8S9ULZ2_PHYIN|nr:Transferase family [Phytophthora infestans]